MTAESVLETPRLLLRELTPDDLDFVATMMADPEVTRYYPKQYTRQESEDWIARQLERYRRDGHGLWLVTEKATGEPVGQIGLAMQEVDGIRQPEIGWLLHRPYWGRGYATEAGAASRDAAFDRWHYGYVISIIRPMNLPSRRVAERLGMTVARHAHFHGFEHCIYELRR